MIMRRPLFGQYEDPYAKLVDAVRREIPKMEATDVPASLRQLAANCLVKDPGTRLSLVEWASFQKAPAEANDARAAAERIAQRRKAAAAASNAVNEGYRTIRELEEEVRRDLRRIAKNVLDGDDFPPRQIEEGDASVDVEFSPSPSFALANLLRVKFSVEVVDPASKVVRVVATAFVVGKGGSQMPSGIPAKNMILEGGYSAGSVLEDSLKNYLILAFDAAQQTVEIPDDGQPEWVAVPG